MTDQLPAPLVPAEVDLRDFATMPLAVQTLRDSRFASEVKPEAFRAGVLLWCAAWHQVPAGSLPDNEAELAKLAGYGFVVKEWRKVKAQALTKFVLCSDGRWYHEEVAERAITAWQSRLEHFYERAKERLRKANKARADEKPPRPPLPTLTFEQWNQRRLAAGTPMEKAEASNEAGPCSGGTAAAVPRLSGGSGTGIPPENALKGEGTERERNGEGTEKENSIGCTPPPPAGPDVADESPPEPAAAPTPYGAITARLRAAGIARANPSEVRFRSLVDAGATADEFLAHVPKALGKRDPFAYLVGTVEGERTRVAETAGQLHRGPMPAPAPPAEPAWRAEKRARMAELAGPAAAGRPAPAAPATETIDVESRLVG